MSLLDCFNTNFTPLPDSVRIFNAFTNGHVVDMFIIVWIMQIDIHQRSWTIFVSGKIMHVLTTISNEDFELPKKIDRNIVWINKQRNTTHFRWFHPKDEEAAIRMTNIERAEGNENECIAALQKNASKNIKQYKCTIKTKLFRWLSFETSIIKLHREMNPPNGGKIFNGTSNRNQVVDRGTKERVASDARNVHKTKNQKPNRYSGSKSSSQCSKVAEKTNDGSTGKLSTQKIEKRFKCQYCDYVGSNMEHFNRNLRTHIGEKSHKCDRWPKRYMQSEDLQVHMKIHIEEYPFNYFICFRGFSQKNENEVHKKNCKNRWYECHLCNEFVTSKVAILEKHMRTHSGKKPSCCKMCMKCFFSDKYAWKLCVAIVVVGLK